MKKISLIIYTLCLTVWVYGSVNQTNSSDNGTRVNGYYILEDFNGTPLPTLTSSKSANLAATINTNPANSTPSAKVVSTGYGGNVYFSISVTLPEGKVVADFDSLFFDLYIGSASNKQLMIYLNGTYVHKVSNNYLNGTNINKGIQKIAFSTFSQTGAAAALSAAGRTFTLGFGNDQGDATYYIDNVKFSGGGNIVNPGNIYTVTLNPGTGTCASASLTETAEGAGVTLPAASSSAKCGVAGYTFVGWAQSAVTETTTAPTLLPAGAFALSQNTTLFAVYTNGTVYNSNPVCSVSLNGTISGGWLIMEDFEGKNISESLLMKNIFNETIVGTATVVANPTIADEKVAHVTIASGNYNTLLKLNLTLPTDKVLANYDQLRFDLYRLANDGNYKKMYIWVDGAKVFEDADYIQQAPATTWTAKTYSFTNLTAGNSFELALGISTDAGNYMIDNVRLFPKADTTTGIDSPDSGINVFKSNNGIGVYCIGNQLLEVYNIAGQKIKSIITTDGLNTIPFSAKGLVVLKIANSRLKIIL